MDICTLNNEVEMLALGIGAFQTPPISDLLYQCEPYHTR